MKIVVTDQDTVVGNGVTLDFLNQFGEVTVYEDTQPEEAKDRIHGADIVLINKVVITAELMDATPTLKMVGLFATGYNNVDVAAAKERGIAVCNVPGYSTEAVAQHTFALILELMNKAGAYTRMVEQGDWVRSRNFSFCPLPITELAGKTLGIIGYGAIGHRVADIAHAFGMTVLVNARHPICEEGVEALTKEEILRKADIVSLHCPLNDDSRNMMNKEAFAMMKKGALFINTARGALVDEHALREALDSGHLGGAGMDVLSKEPMDKASPLLGAPRCVITPHIAWAGVETRHRLVGIVEENIRSFLNGTPQNNVAR